MAALQDMYTPIPVPVTLKDYKSFEFLQRDLRVTPASPAGPGGTPGAGGGSLHAGSAGLPPGLSASQHGGPPGLGSSGHARDSAHLGPGGSYRPGSARGAGMYQAHPGGSPAGGGYSAAAAGNSPR